MDKLSALKLAVHERYINGEITESQKNYLLESVEDRYYEEKVTMGHVKAAIAITATALSLAAAIKAAIDKYKEFKGYENNPKLNSLRLKVEASEKKIKELRKEMIYTETEYNNVRKYWEDESEYHDSKVVTDTKIKEWDNVFTDENGVEHHEKKRKETNVQTKNKDYDPIKAGIERQKAKKAEELAKKYAKLKDELTGEISKLYDIRNDLNLFARKNKEVDKQENKDFNKKISNVDKAASKFKFKVAKAMSGLPKYNSIFESLNERVEEGSMSIDVAERLNEIAYEKYVEDEDCSDHVNNLKLDIYEAYEEGLLSENAKELYLSLLD